MALLIIPVLKRWSRARGPTANFGPEIDQSQHAKSVSHIITWNIPRVTYIFHTLTRALKASVYAKKIQIHVNWHFPRLFHGKATYPMPKSAENFEARKSLGMSQNFGIEKLQNRFDVYMIFVNFRKTFSMFRKSSEFFEKLRKQFKMVLKFSENLR